MLQTMSVDVDNIDPLYIDQYYRNSSINQALPELLTNMQPFDDEQLSGLSLPVLVLIGDQDIINSPDGLDRAKQVLPRVSTAIVKDAGHFLGVDNASTVNQQVTHFVANKGRDKAGCRLPRRDSSQ